MSNQQKITFKDSLKSWDTENILDRHFYRPLGFKGAMLLRSTFITPNAVTIFSIFVGVAACLLYYPQSIWVNMIGFGLLVFANILDCVDGQLARITGIKSEIGRILDGFCGDIWFLTFYTVMTLRLINYEGWGWWTILIAVASALSHLLQASMVDYYKTLHLHFLSGGKNSEFGSAASIREKLSHLTWKKNPDKKFFMKLYYLYTREQEMNTPNLQRYMAKMNRDFPDGYPEETVQQFRAKSLRLMPLLDMLTFNFRSLIMLVTLLVHAEWVYFAVEILVLNPLLGLALRKHEKMCRELLCD
jgi:phosphatidylglycerophosphate synthase